ncbi:hypothetical protein HMPREF0682_2322 [Propionibacterium acidifaciens F0233]|uniref:Uncharacterized protein n=1 Tax=Propionibacterium acidifaciens F0233 TaxID=553198 RepID=U2SFB3_9ACTN|nr:hypothetical protein HMPREF0682_2322 [Propionibacterium acidifaciens F0233]
MGVHPVQSRRAHRARAKGPDRVAAAGAGRSPWASGRPSPALAGFPEPLAANARGAFDRSRRALAGPGGAGRGAAPGAH